MSFPNTSLLVGLIVYCLLEWCLILVSIACTCSNISNANKMPVHYTCRYHGIVVFHLSFPLMGVNIICRPVNQYQVIDDKLHVVVITIIANALNMRFWSLLIIFPS